MVGSSKISSSCSLEALLSDPLIQLLMKADKVDASYIKDLYDKLPGHVGQADKRFPPKHVAIYPSEDVNYRSGIGVMLLNDFNEVFVGQRTGIDDAWQMPQGGIEDGELPAVAALRELREEIGTDNVEILAVGKGWLRYDLPSELIGNVWGGRWQGQQQKWFAMRFLGSDTDINVATEHPEFSAWQWRSPAHLVDLIVPFKRELYRDVLDEFHLVHTAKCLRRSET
jgi:putative (di)nucleoside polyphosphate hydrolase